MECLKYHYALKKGYKDVNNSFIKPSANNKLRITRSGKYKVKTGIMLEQEDKYTFKQLVEEIYEEYKLNILQFEGIYWDLDSHKWETYIPPSLLWEIFEGIKI